MIRKIMCASLGAVIALQLNAGAVVAENNLPIKTMTNTDLKMFNADYWVDKIADKDKVLMSLAEIKQYNNEIMKTQSNVSFDLASFSSTFSKEKLQQHIDIKPFKDPCFVDGKAIGKDYWDKLREQINLEAIKAENEIKYGLSVRRTNLKIFPTLDIISDAADDPAFDQLQNTAVLAYEPLLILHKSKDEKWLYIYMHNCSGWVLAQDVATCKSKEEWLETQKIDNFIDNDKFLVVTGNKIKLDASFESPELSNMEFSMGTLLQLAKPSEIPAFVDSRAPFDNYVVKLPVRNSKGGLEYKLTLVPASKDVSVGYMKFTRENVIRQVFKMHGDRYGWGGMLDVRDCSSLVLEIYRCFGFRLPRNTETQVKCPGKTLNVDGLSIKGREEMLDNLKPGAALYFPGHTMIYLGKDKDKYYVMSALGMFAEFPDGSDKAKIIRTRSVIINDLTVKRASGKMWIEALTAGKQFEKSKVTDLDGLKNKAAIEGLIDRFVISGKEDGTFDPLGKITRAQVVTLLSRGLRIEGDKEYAAKTFKDCQQAWYDAYLGGVAKEGFINATEDGLFNPDELVDYDYLKDVIQRVLKKQEVDSKTAEGEQLLQKIFTVDDAFLASKEEKTLNRYETAVVIDNLLKSVEKIKEEKSKVKSK